jgi:hypothetical protein
MKKFLGKGLLTIFFIGSIIGSRSVNVKAVNIDFGTVGKTAGAVEEFVIYAKPDKDANLGITLHISAENAEFVGYSASPLFQIGTCAGNVKYTSREVCLDVIKSTPFNATDKIGTIKIKWGPMNGTSKITVSDKYFSETKELSNHTKENSFSVIGGIEKPAITNTPVIQQTVNNTKGSDITMESLKNPTNAVIFIGIGAVLVLLSIVFVTKLKKK